MEEENNYLDFFERRNEDEAKKEKEYDLMIKTIRMIKEEIKKPWTTTEEVNNIITDLENEMAREF